MGVFMDMGLSGWLNILICVLLTLLYYIPGLTYALLIYILNTVIIFIVLWFYGFMFLWFYLFI